MGEFLTATLLKWIPLPKLVTLPKLMTALSLTRIIYTFKTALFYADKYRTYQTEQVSPLKALLILLTIFYVLSQAHLGISILQHK